MNAEIAIASLDRQPVPSRHPARPAGQRVPAPGGFGALETVRARMDELEAALEALASLGDRDAARSVRRLQRQLRRVEPSVTLIGQVKAGKTSLVNALVGWPDLLPADVNPWTSVVTSIHLSPRPQPAGDRATFRFFAEDEWTRLLERGGRIGELAGRAGAEDEVARVSQQLAQMREKSRRRLGNRFEMLMGQEHAYGYLDPELVERYVCLGDDFEDDHETSTAQGRFADITKSADLFLQRDGWPVDFCIRDTPGVNDTFMMREQITIRAIRESRICVVVLSAHQALSTVDLALIRLISNLDSREVVIFVNRIDELSDPARQVPEIETSIRATLAHHKGPTEAEIVFGSACWANHALGGAGSDLAPDSAAALEGWAETGAARGLPPEAAIWQLSGLPALIDAIGRRAARGIARDSIERTARAGLNVLAGFAASDRLAQSEGRAALPRAQVPAAAAALEAETMAAFDAAFAAAEAGLATRLDRAHAAFLERATASLVTNLERYGDSEVWHYDATGLRVLLRGTWQVFARQAQAASAGALAAAAEGLRRLYVDAFGISDEGFRIETPAPPRVAPPVGLGQTIALDLSTSWWGRWWRRRRGLASYAADFAEIIRAETAPIVAGLREDQARGALEEARAQLAEFLAAQRETLTALALRDDRPRTAPLVALDERRATLAAARGVFGRLAGDRQAAG